MVQINTFFEKLLGGEHPQSLGVAVSGGSDSTALLHLIADWAKHLDCEIHAVTVDHGLRAEAGDEATEVARQCAGLNIPHDTLRWTGWDGSGNLQNEAREARYRLMTEWGAQKGITDIALGHTQDDQAETVLMRLARGSGVDGLSAIPPVRHAHGIRWLRPLLQCQRAELRAYLNDNGTSWIDDPSNDDPKYDRVKTRAALEVLQTLGVTSKRLAETANRMASARRVLEQVTHDAAKEIAQVRGGAVQLDTGALKVMQPETRRRLLVHGLCWVSGNTYSPRHASLLELENNINDGNTSTLHGCLITISKGICIIAREPAAVATLAGGIGEVWDKRWRLTGPEKPGLVVRSLGDKGLDSCENWRETGLHRSVLTGSPAVWSGDKLISAPMARFNTEWGAKLIKGENDFLTSVLSH